MSSTYPIVNVEWKTPKVFELSVKRNGLQFTPGDSVALSSADGSESRPYSIASGVDESVLRFLIQRMPGGNVSEFLSKLSPGDQIGVSEPFGWFRPGQSIGEKPFIFIATGTGIAPFLSYLRANPERPPSCLFYGLRKLEDAIELDYLESTCPLKLAISREKVAPHSQGRVTDLLPNFEFDPETHFYLCGLDAMIDEVSDWLEEQQGIDFSQIHREVFFYVSP